MDALLKKLNLKDQQHFLVLNAPEDLHTMLQDWNTFIPVLKDSNGVEKIEAALVFCTKLEEVALFAPSIHSKLVEDALFWFAYPKGSSKKYTCEFNRDTGWVILGELGYEGVRMVAIDADWSALRFRKAKHIKNITRDPSWIMSEDGKKKAK